MVETVDVPQHLKSSKAPFSSAFQSVVVSLIFPTYSLRKNFSLALLLMPNRIHVALHVFVSSSNFSLTLLHVRMADSFLLFQHNLSFRPPTLILQPAPAAARTHVLSPCLLLFCCYYSWQKMVGEKRESLKPKVFSLLSPLSFQLVQTFQLYRSLVGKERREKLLSVLTHHDHQLAIVVV